jgi:hypothetical protein
LDEVAPAQAFEYRLGREIIWMGNFEDEGSSLWNLNSNDEWYDNTESFQGERSLCHRRLSDASMNIVTNLEGRIRRYDGTDFTIQGCVKTQNGAEVTIEARYYETRYTSQILGSQDIGDSISGDTGWAYYFADFSVPSSTNYFDIRCNSQVPESGEALSWFDDVGIIQWSDWASAVTPLPITNPNDFYYIQLRTPTETSEAYLTYTETTYGPTPLPSMSFDPASFEIVLNPEATATGAVTVGNYGAARLDFTVASTADWLYPDALTGTVEPGADSTIALTFDASGLVEGIYESQLILRSNDPDQSLLFIPAEMTVTSSPIVEVGVTPNGSSVELSWPPVPGATAYYIYRSETPFGPWSLISVETSPVYTDENAVELFEQAYYQVTAELSSGSTRRPPRHQFSQTK